MLDQALPAVGFFSQKTQRPSVMSSSARLCAVGPQTKLMSTLSAAAESSSLSPGAWIASPADFSTFPLHFDASSSPTCAVELATEPPVLVDSSSLIAAEAAVSMMAAPLAAFGSMPPSALLAPDASSPLSSNASSLLARAFSASTRLAARVFGIA